MMDDLISRQAAIEVIDAVFPVDPMKSEYAQGIACGAALAKTYVEQLPSAQPTADVRDDTTAHKVIGGGEHDGATCWFECSRCGKTVDVNDKYCSECGARFEQ